MSMFIVKQTSIATFLAEIIRTIRKAKKNNMTTEFKRAMNNYNVLCDIFLLVTMLYILFDNEYIGKDHDITYHEQTCVL